MKVLFLDFDGVLNSRLYLDGAHARRRQIERAGGSVGSDAYMLDPVRAGRVNRIVEQTGAKVVISSSWRLLDSLQTIVGFLDEVGFAGHVIGMTPNLGLVRGHEIQAWLDAATDPVESFVILDDLDEMEHLSDRLVLTSMVTGIQDEHVEKAVALLGVPYRRAA